MCRICGIVDFENARGVDIGALCAMRSSCGEGKSVLYITDSAGLCTSNTVRNSSTDEKIARPETVICEQKIYTALFCGELCNSFALREELSSLGAVFSANSPAEIAAYSYIYFGKHCPSRLCGSFVLCIYDECAERLFAARSRMGERRFFYTFRGSAMHFSSYAESLTDKRFGVSEAYSLERGMCGFFTSSGFSTEKY